MRHETRALLGTDGESSSRIGTQLPVTSSKLWLLASLWVIVYGSAIISRYATKIYKQDSNAQYPDNPLPEPGNFDQRIIVAISILIIYFHIIVTILLSPTSLQYVASFHHMLLPLITVLIWFFWSYAVFEPIRHAHVTNDNPLGKGFDMSGHYLTLSLITTIIVGELMYSPLIRFCSVSAVILYVLEAILYLITVLFLYVGFITGFVFHQWWESLVGLTCGLGSGLLINFGLGYWLPRNTNWKFFLRYRTSPDDGSRLDQSEDGYAHLNRHTDTGEDDEGFF